MNLGTLLKVLRAAAGELNKRIIEKDYPIEGLTVNNFKLTILLSAVRE